MNDRRKSLQGIKLQVLNSWDESAMANTMQQTPEERIRETVALILRVYGVTEEGLRQRRGKLHITFHKPW